jgi:hypothetical protein
MEALTIQRAITYLEKTMYGCTVTNPARNKYVFKQNLKEFGRENIEREYDKDGIIDFATAMVAQDEELAAITGDHSN